MKFLLKRILPFHFIVLSVFTALLPQPLDAMRSQYNGKRSSLFFWGCFLGPSGLIGRFEIDRVDRKIDAFQGLIIKSYQEDITKTHSLDGWLDSIDEQFAGDYMRLGYNQMLFINENSTPGAGKIMILDYDPDYIAPRVKYLENWGDNHLLDGWMDRDDSRIDGDFLGLGHNQVLFVNQQEAPGSGKVMIVDYSTGTPQVKYLENWGDNHVLDGWLKGYRAGGYRLIAGDFKKLGYTQLMLLSFGGVTGDGKIMILDYSSGRPQVLYREKWGDNHLLDGFFDSRFDQFIDYGKFCRGELRCLDPAIVRYQTGSSTYIGISYYGTIPVQVP